MMVRGYRTFREFQRSGEGIATNILADRLQKLEAGGVIIREAAAEDGRSTHYRLTAKGIALAPVLLEILIWGAHHEEDGCALRGDCGDGAEPRRGGGGSLSALGAARSHATDSTFCKYGQD